MRDLTGIGLVILGVALHRDPPRRKDPSAGLDSVTGRGTGPTPPSAGQLPGSAAVVCT
jgi:hypothetical protein